MHDAAREAHPFRHEALSVAVCMDLAGLGCWVSHALSDPRARAVVLAAVMGHHVRASTSAPAARVPRDEVVYLDHLSLAPLWHQLARCTGAQRSPGPQRLALPRVAWEDLLFEYVMLVRDAVGSVPERKLASLVALAACCKAALVAADTVASARISGRHTAAKWARKVLRRGLQSDELGRIVDAHLDGRPPYPFQERVASSDERVTLVEAGCGNGKTLAAYMWAQRRAVGGRLVFCYPTTGTTSAGFQDYLLAQTDLERALMHGRASADIEHILDNGGRTTRIRFGSLTYWTSGERRWWHALLTRCSRSSRAGVVPSLASLSSRNRCLYSTKCIATTINSSARSSRFFAGHEHSAW